MPGPVVEEVRGPVLVVRLHRPEVRNAIDRPTAEALSAAMDRLDDDPALRAGVLTGDGPAFCAGTDLAAVAAGTSVELEDRGWYGVLGRPPAKPLVAAVEGAAVGGGLELALGCDMVVAAHDARFALPEVRLGVLPAAGALFRLPARIPPVQAAELVLTGRVADAAELERWGLLNRVVAPGAAVDAAIELAAATAAGSPVAVAQALCGVRDAVGAADAEGWRRTRELLGPVLRSADRHEGVAAFRERRPPRWTGR
ncbi:MAG: enoyl-CoA hydratase-related protein [Solirubrobacteraceae bacterium]|nr:enoyl-CoA hydratase-related protein [Solirubrobacteraceae bacterium]